MPSKPVCVLLAALWALASLACRHEAANGAEKAAQQAFEDPVPPAVQKPEPVSPPNPKNNPTVTFHREPKPLPAGAVTRDWKSFLGPSHNAVSSETKLLKKWPKEGLRPVWEMEAGSGYSSPAIAGERLVYFHRLGGEEIVECLHPENGKRYWRFSYPTQYQDRYGYNNGPRASPTIDEDRVYTYGAEGKLHCLKLETGQVIWKRDLAAEFELSQDFFGTASTPLIENGLLIVNLGAPGGPTVAAFDKRTGKMMWGAGEEWGPSYASPIPATVHDRRRVFVFAGGESQPPSGGLLSIDPASGKTDFAFPWRSRSYESVNASSPVVVGNQVFISASYRTGGALLDIRPDFTHEVAWTTDEFGLHWNTPLYRNGYLYGFDGRNEPDASLACLNWKTGEVVWRETPEWNETVTISGRSRQLNASTLRGSLLWADGRFLALGELGHLLWLDLSPSGYRELARTRLFLARQTWCPPVLSRGLLYISQNTRDFETGKGPRLLCYDLRAEQ